MKPPRPAAPLPPGFPGGYVPNIAKVSEDRLTLRRGPPAALPKPSAR